MDDLDHHLAGCDRVEDLLSKAFLLDPVDEFTGHPEMDVRRQQGLAHFLQALGHVLLGQFPLAAECAEGAADTVGQGFQHSPLEMVMVRKESSASFIDR